MIWNKKKDGAENPGAETPAAQTTKAPVLFLQKNWKWLVPVVVVAAAGAVFLIGGGNKAASGDVTYAVDDARPSGCLQLPERHRHAEPGQYIYRQVSGGRQDPHRRL